MLTHWPDNNVAIAAGLIEDVTEPAPIPAGTRVRLIDFDRAGDLWIVEHRGRIYQATPAELTLSSPQKKRRASASARAVTGPFDVTTD